MLAQGLYFITQNQVLYDNKKPVHSVRDFSSKSLLFSGKAVGCPSSAHR